MNKRIFAVIWLIAIVGILTIGVLFIYGLFFENNIPDILLIVTLAFLLIVLFIVRKVEKKWEQ